MKLDWAALLTPTYLIGGVTALVIIGLAVAGVQKSCGKRHEGAALIEGIKADASAERLKDALQQVKGLQNRVAELEETGRGYKLAYEKAKARVQGVPANPTPSDPGELGNALQREGFKVGIRVEAGLSSSILTFEDAGLAYVLSQRAKRAESLEAALGACDLLQSQQELTLKAKDEVILKTNEALKASMDESLHRQAQADELGKALKIEKRKGWQKYAIGVAGVLVGVYAGRK